MGDLLMGDVMVIDGESVAAIVAVASSESVDVSATAASFIGVAGTLGRPSVLSAQPMANSSKHAVTIQLPINRLIIIPSRGQVRRLSPRAEGAPVSSSPTSSLAPSKLHIADAVAGLSSRFRACTDEDNPFGRRFVDRR